MAHLAIMRAKKLKGAVSLNGSTAHIARARETPNADADRRALNTPLVGDDNAKAIRAGIADRTPDKFRKDAVRAFEFVLTASPDFFKDNSKQTGHDYLASAVDWLKNEFGEANVVSAVIHHDETSPHVHVIAVPLVEETGKLSAKRFVDGKADMGRMQTRFADWQSSFGIERGVKRVQTQRDHTTIAEWQAGHSQLDDREKALKEREAKADAQLEEAERLNAETRQKAADSEGRALTAYRIARRERSAVEFEKQQLADREARQATHEQRLQTLERELSARGEKLQGGEKALQQRQAEIDKAGSVLQQRLDAARASQQRFEQQKASWIAENKPQVPEIVGHLRHADEIESALSLAEFVDELDAHGVDIYPYCSENGLTSEGRALLEQHEGAQERAERFEQTFTPSRDSPGM